MECYVCLGTFYWRSSYSFTPVIHSYTCPMLFYMSNAIFFLPVPWILVHLSHVHSLHTCPNHLFLRVLPVALHLSPTYVCICDTRKSSIPLLFTVYAPFPDIYCAPPLFASVTFPTCSMQSVVHTCLMHSILDTQVRYTSYQALFMSVTPVHAHERFYLACLHP